MLTAFLRRWWAPLLAGGLALVALVQQTWPVYEHPGTWALGGPGDGWGGTAIVQDIVHEGLNPFAPGRMAAFNAPHGLPVPWQLNIQQWPSSLILYGVTWLTGDGEIGFNLYVLLGCVLTAATMSWLLLRLTGDCAVSVILGFAISLAPFFVINRGGHAAFVHLWPLVLVILAVHAVHVLPTIKRGAVAGLVAFIAMSWSGYHLLLAGVVLATLLIGFGLAALGRADRSARLRAYAVAAGVPLVGIVVVAAVITLIGAGADPTSTARENPKVALYAYGARWYEYTVPTARSRLFGDATAPWLASRLHGSNGTETPLYLGISVLALALVGAVAVFKQRSRSHRTAFIVCGLGIVAVGAWVSLPPTVTPLGVSIPTPSDVVFEVFTTWRVYSRLVLVVLIGVFVLAAAGLTTLAGSRGPRRYLVLGLAALVVPLDLWTTQEPVATIAAPQVADVVRRLPPGAIAVYPLGRGETDGYAALYNQQFYGRPVLNGFDDQPEESRLPLLTNLSDPATAMRLGTLGIRYALVIRRPIDPGLADPGIRPAPGIRRVGRGMYGPYPANVYEIPRRPGTVAVFASEGFAMIDGTKPDEGQWLQGDTGKLEVWGVCRAICRGRVVFNSVPLGAAKTVDIYRGSQRVAHAVIGKRQRVSVPLTLRSGETTLTIRVRPGAVAVKDTIPGSSDPRRLSVRVEHPTWFGSPHAQR
jgi:hypothetical protein